jgi:hypothetical protein
VRLGFYVTGSATASYAGLVAQVEERERSGFDSVSLRERHFHRDHGGRNFFASPRVVAAHIAQRTRRVRIGVGARILPLDHPRSARPGSGARARRRVAARLECGIVGTNDALRGAAHFPFGGLKQSGLGKEGGRMGLDEFLDTKLVSEAG